MNATRTWLVLSGALVVGAGAVGWASGDVRPGVLDGGPGVQLNPPASAPAVPGADPDTMVNADTGPEASADPVTAVTPASPEPVTPASPQSADPASPDSPQSAD